MSQQIASLYASLGFNVDQSGLTAFRTEMQTLKKEFTEVLKDTANMNRRLKTLAGRLGEFNRLFNPQNITDWRKRLVASIRQYSNVMNTTRQQMVTFGQDVFQSERKLNWFENRLKSNITTLDTYRQHLEPVVLLLERLRGAAGSPLPRPRGGYGGGSGGNQGGSSRGQGGSGNVGGGLLQAMGVGAFLRPMLPTGMGIGGMLGAGYGFRELVQAGREMQAMESKLKAVSETSSVFESNLAFVNKTSQELALNIKEFGDQYASIFQSAKSQLGVEQIQTMTEGMNKYFRTMQMTPEQIKGSLRAVGQMLNKGQVMAEELKNQLGERAAGVLQIFTKAAGMGDDVKGFMKLMEAGKVGVDIVEKAGIMMGEWADKQGTLSVALQQSAAKQELFNNKLRTLSLLILKSGLDQALAAMFSALVPILDAVGKGLLFTISLIKKLWTFLKAIGTYIKENPLATTFTVAGLSILALIPIVKALGLTLSLVLGRAIISVGVLNGALLLMKSRVLLVAGAVGGLIFLFSELEGYFKGEENNFLMTWYYTVQMLASEMDLFFAKTKYNMSQMFAGEPEKQFLDQFGDPLRNYSDVPFSDKMKFTLSDWWGYLKNDPVFNHFSGNSSNSPAQAVQQSAPANIENKFFLNLGGLSLQDKTRLMGGETVQLPPPMLRSPALEYGGLGTNR